VTARYPFAPVDSVLARRGLTVTAAAALFGVDRAQVNRWRRVGLSDVQADRVAVALGLTPGELWAEWLEGVMAEQEAAETARRAKASEWKRRKYQSDPEHRAERLARNRQWKAENRSTITFKAALYRASNAERRREVRRARYQANREAELARQRAYDRRRAAERRGVSSTSATAANHEPAGHHTRTGGTGSVQGGGSVTVSDDNLHSDEEVA
jgi:plasmid maintenance system antidote protein VapI